jgi:hypothetical protein
MIGFNRLYSIDAFIEKLHALYLNPAMIKNSNLGLIQNLTVEEIKYLNEKIALDKLVGVENKYLLNRLLQNSNNLPFVTHILSISCLNLEVNENEPSINTNFQLLFEAIVAHNDHYGDPWQLMLLYDRGYASTKADEVFLINFYKHEIRNQLRFEYWCIARIIFKLNDAQKIRIAREKSKVIFTLLSLKLKKPIGIRYPNLLGVANNALLHYTEHTDLILYAMKHYQIYDEIVSKDRRGSFNYRLENLMSYKPIQDLNFLELAFDIFPELKH